MIYFKHTLFCLHDLFKVIFEDIENRFAFNCLPLTHRIIYSGSFIFLILQSSPSTFQQLLFCKHTNLQYNQEVRK